jgi:hypothetical protein
MIPYLSKVSSDVALDRKFGIRSNEGVMAARAREKSATNLKRVNTVETSKRKRPVPKGSHDAIRIVPLAVPDQLRERPLGHPPPQPPVPHLTYRNGPLIRSAQVFTVYWGNAWTGALSGLATQINQFFSFVLTSSLIDQLTEYSVPNFAISHGNFIGTISTSTPALGATVTDADIQQMLQQEIASSAVPAPSANTLYFIYLPPGVTVTMGGSSSCQAFCGYHNHISGQIFYAAMPYPGCNGCLGSLSTFDAITSVSSHELCEAITDPIPGQGWYDDTFGEIGDICAWKTKQIGNYVVQKEWSNRTVGSSKSPSTPPKGSRA